MPKGGGCRFLRIFAPVCGSTHGFLRNWPFGNGLGMEIALGRAFLPPSNAAPDAGTLIRRRRIGFPAAERAFDGVETASSRLGLNPTASDRRSGGWTGIRRGRINVPSPDWAFDGRGKPVFPAECQFDASGTALCRPRSGRARRERPFRRWRGGSMRWEGRSRRVETGSPPSDERPASPVEGGKLLTAPTETPGASARPKGGLARPVRSASRRGLRGRA